MAALQQIAAIVFVFSILGVALWWLRGKKLVAFGPARSGTAKLQVIDRVRLTPQHSVHLLRVGKRDLVVAVYASGCTLLETVPASETDN